MCGVEHGEVKHFCDIDTQVHDAQSEAAMGGNSWKITLQNVISEKPRKIHRSSVV